MKICSKMRRLGAILTVVVMRWSNSQRRNKATNRTTFVVFGRKKEKNTNKTFLIARMRPASQIAYSTQDNQQCLTVKAPNFSLDWRKGAGSGSLGMLRAFFLICFVLFCFVLFLFVFLFFDTVQKEQGSQKISASTADLHYVMGQEKKKKRKEYLPQKLLNQHGGSI